MLREDFRDESDVDVLVSFASSAEWSLLDHVAMQDEMSELLGRQGGSRRRGAIEASSNRIRREAILASLEPVYRAR